MEFQDLLHLLLEVVIVHSSLSSVATAGRDCPLVVFLVSGQHAMIDSFVEIDGLVLVFFFCDSIENPAVRISKYPTVQLKPTLH